MSPEIPHEAEVIRLAREAMNMTAQSAAEASRAHDGKGISAAYWRDVERGYGGRRGQRVPARASARALAAMARVVGVMPAQLAAAGRGDAARVLEEILRRESPAPLPYQPRVTREFGAAIADLTVQFQGRAKVARAIRPAGPLPGGTVFPDLPAAAEAWDSFTVQGFTEDMLPAMTAAVVALNAEAARRNRDGTASGLHRGCIAGHAVSVTGRQQSGRLR